MLSVGQMSRIQKEAMLNLPPTLTSDEALAFRKRMELDLAKMAEKGIAPDLPIDFD